MGKEESKPKVVDQSLTAADAKKIAADYQKSPPIDQFLAAVNRSASSGKNSVEVATPSESQVAKLKALGYKIEKSRRANLSVISF